MPEIIECRDSNGEEIIPTADLAVAFSLPGMLEADLEGAPKSVEGIKAKIATLSLLIQFSTLTLADLVVSDGPGRLRRQKELRETTIKGLNEEGAPEPRSAFREVANTIYGLSPDEIGYFSRVHKQYHRKATSEELVYAGRFAPQPLGRIATEKQARLSYNTPETTSEFATIADAYNALMVLENHSFANTMLHIAMALGDDSQLEASAEAFERMRAVGGDITGMSRQQQLDAQVGETLRIAELTRAVAQDAELDSATRNNLLATIVAYESVAHSNLYTAVVLNDVVYGRTFRLNGNTHPSSKDLSLIISRLPKEQEDPVPAAAEPEQPESYRSYVTRLREYILSIDVLQPETLTAKELRRRKLDEARAALVKGEQNGDGVTIIAGRSKTATQQYISNIEFLRSFITEAKDLGEAKDKFEKALADTANTSRNLDALLNEPGGERSAQLLADLQVAAPDIEPFDELVADVRDDWDIVGFLMKKYWPGKQEAAEQLRRLLFLSKEEIEGLE